MPVTSRKEGGAGAAHKVRSTMRETPSARGLQSRPCEDRRCRALKLGEAHDPPGRHQVDGHAILQPVRGAQLPSLNPAAALEGAVIHRISRRCMYQASFAAASAKSPWAPSSGTTDRPFATVDT